MKVKIDFQILKSLLLGQLLSLFISGTAVSSAYLSQINVNIPIFQSFQNYFLLALTFGIYFVYTRSKILLELIKLRGWIYLIAAIIDVEANYIIVLSYQYTSVTSVQLLDCMTIPTAIIASIIILKVRYKISNYIGAALCLLGSTGMVLVDALINDKSWNGSNVLLGDILIVIGAILYGISNVIQEYAVRKYNQVEYLGMMSLISCVISGIQIALIERKNLFFAFYIHHNNYILWTNLALFAISMFLLYSLMPYVMSISSCVVVNLSLLTADVYALFIGIFLFHNKFHALYFLAYVTIMIGVGIYVSRTPYSRLDDETINEEDRENRMRILPTEIKSDDL